MSKYFVRSQSVTCPWYSSHSARFIATYSVTNCAGNTLATSGSASNASIASSRVRGRRLPAAPRRRPVVGQVLDRIARIELLAHSLEAGGEQERGGEIRVGGGVDAAVLDAGPVARQAQHARAVVVAVGRPHRRPRDRAVGEPLGEPLVGVDRRRADRRQRGRVPQDAGHEAVRRLAPPAAARVVGVAEQVRAALDVGEAHVEVRAAPPRLGVRLRHERRDEPVLLRDLLRRDAGRTSACRPCRAPTGAGSRTRTGRRHLRRRS